MSENNKIIEDIELRVDYRHENDEDNGEGSDNELLIDTEEKHKKKANVQTSSKKERIYWIDALRIFANFLVIFIHCTGVDLKPTPFKSTNWKIFHFYNNMLKPCVPLFIMISGVLFLDPKRPITVSSLYKKSIPRLVRSYLFWSSYYSVVDEMFINIRNVRYHFSKTLVRDTVKKIILGGGHLWYVNFCIGLYMMTPIFRELIPNRKVAWYTVILSVIFAQFLPTVCDFFDSFTKYGGGVGRDFLETLRLSAVSSYINYYMLGYLLNTKIFRKKWQIYSFYLVGILGLVLTVSLRFLSCYSMRRDSGAFGNYNSFNVAMETIGIFMFFKYTVDYYLPKFLRWRIFKKLLINLSDCTFGIYLIHMTVYHGLYKLEFHPMSFNPIFCGPIYSVIVYLLSYFCIYMLRKIPILRPLI
jgi:surface polysaccharide O-acyltransferase-like enzyme